MARIRSIKPEFFDDEDLCALSFGHRLAYIGLWTQADKAGRMEDRPKRLKARIFPFDSVDMDAFLADLAQVGFIVRYSVDEKPFISIKATSWTKHQRPRQDEPESVLPPIDTGTVTSPLRRSDDSVTAESVGKERKGEGERKGMERENADVASAPDAAQLQELWNCQTTNPIPRCREFTAKRRRHANARLAERPLTEWAEVFSRIQASAFCRGENDRGWVATFDWAIGSADVAVKVLEGKYDNRNGSKSVQTERPFSERESLQAREWFRKVGYCPHGGEHTPAECMAHFIKTRLRLESVQHGETV